jgi:hypothetical protein
MMKTRHSVLRAVADGQSQGLVQFTEIYRDLLVEYLMAMQIAREEAADVAHDFLMDKVIACRDGASIVDRYQEARRKALEESREAPRFGRYLSVSLKHYYFDRRRQQKRDPHTYVELTPDAVPSPGEESDLAAPSGIDLAFAHRFVEELLRRVERECEEKRQEPVWGILERQLVRPALTGASPAQYAELVCEFNLKTPKQACNLLQTGIRKIQRTLQEMTREHAAFEGMGLDVAMDQYAEVQIDDICQVLMRYGVGLSPVAVEANVSASEGCSSIGIRRLLRTTSSHEVWSTDDLRQMWNQLLAIPLQSYLDGTDDLILSQGSSGGEQTLLNYLTLDEPSLSMLTAIKKFGRLVVRQPSRKDVQREPEDGMDLPPQIGFVLYVMSMAVAKLKCHTMISKDGPAKLEQRLRVVIGTSWIDERTRKLAWECVAAVAEGSS